LTKYDPDEEDFTMNIRTPAQVLTPGEFLKQELECRGWSQVELAEILARPPRLISEIVGGKRAITPETAKGLGAALDTSAELWMNLETGYQLSRTRVETSVVSRRARLYAKFPVKELLRRGWVRSASDLGMLEANFCQFFGINSIEENPTFGHAAKKARYDSAPIGLQLAWLMRASQVAEKVEARLFSVSALKAAIDGLKSCLRNAEDVTKAAALLLKAGVRLVVVEFLPSAKLDGACFWINNGKSPVIALSLRLDRIDNFWHTLFHEIDHVLHGEGKEAPIIDLFDSEESTGKEIPAVEQRANKHAANYCIQEDALRTWIAHTQRVSSRAHIVAFADQIGVHPGLVVGQLQHHGSIPYSFHRDLLEKVRPLVVASTPTDGYGKT
jgi:HTH-type transcriptional regulator / antitoxin HigA